MNPKSLNILVLSNCAFDEYQGSGYVIVNTMRCLEKLGHHVKGADNSVLSVARWMGGRANRYRMAIGMALYLLGKRKQLPQTDLVIFYGAECFAALWVLNNLLGYKGKSILHSNGIEMLVDEAMGQGKVNRYQKFFQWNMHPLFAYAYHHVDKLITVSDYNQDFVLEKLKIPPASVGLLEPALHTDFFERSIPALPKKPVIMYCGGWLPIKGAEAIRVAMPSILSKYSDYSLRLVGVGNSFRKEDFFPENLLNRIEVIPYVRDREKLIELYLESRFFIFPSLADSFGLVVAEAMYCGCTAIVSKTGLGYSLRHKMDAWVLPEPSAEMLEEGLVSLIENEALSNELSKSGKLRVQGLNWKDYQNRLSEILCSL